jgi:hypothetical protein
MALFMSPRGSPSIELSLNCNADVVIVNDNQLLAHGRLFSPVTPTSSTTKTGGHDKAEILLKVALNTINQSNQI